jgi:hypothetical protein
MTRFQITLRCRDCNHKYKRILTAEDEMQLAELPDPPCPICLKVQNRIGMDVAGGKAPAVGGSLTARAVDTTAEIVMQDYKMTDLRSDVREGESAAPKLHPAQQEKVDNFFGGAKRRQMGGIMGLQPRQLIQAATSGRFMTPDTVNPVATQHAHKDRPPIHIVAGDGVRPTK